ncbi:DNA mismatch repair endonuclease MutL [Lacticaseibacillus sharpeae]|uniref:DNA mismatch repair protein MutL n=1 Tax=Lacticaseibacillus sharpeae JCM 1186 = DSM 20505 TaxID=1291052 RepID=A0A0R1ZHC8_9LACO|nr:DNA mismatch repair endonuclease MutL [Lacticaseibacillus sharpeae]KRM54286.1 DNA mismatch repair protein [Lacticaseibacillus sharpeae JCM 1186 = DSM 20505]
MPHIHELSEALTNQIAAGEVIERPASLIKELTENSIDAGATQIDIRVVDAGLTLMEVMDNGSGIDREDVPVAFKRHATSKIATVRDLFAIHSLGFRGEALASIASVADVTLATATVAGVGTEAHLVGGKLVDQHSQAFRQGTSIKVADLFFNTPARLKYVRSQATELSHIVDIVSRLALGHPEIAFTLRNGDKVAFKTTGNGDLQQTIAGVYGVNIARSMLAIAATDSDFSISGYVSLPDTTRSSRNNITLLINGRYFKNYNLVKGIIAGYGSKLMVGRFPVAVIAIELDPKLVDVNVHPTKQEVRISKERELADLLKTSIYARLSNQNLIPDALHNLNRQVQPKKAEQTTFNVQRDVSTVRDSGADATEARTLSTGRSLFGMPADVNARRQNQTWAQPAPAPAPADEQRAASQDDQQTTDDQKVDLGIDDLDGTSIFTEPDRLAAWDKKYAQPAQTEPFGNLPAPETAAAPVAIGATGSTEPFPDLRYLGQLHGTYLLAETEKAFYMVDQHAAQERINYEYYRVEIGKVEPAQQQLLTPIVLDYPAGDALKIRAARDVLHEVGVDLEEFGQNSFIASAHPTWFKPGQEEDTLKEMIDWVLADGHISVAAFREKAAIMMSCKRAIKANHHLDARQAQALLTKLAEAENPYNCPHGRPVLVSFSNTDLEKMFKRIQDSHESDRWSE